MTRFEERDWQLSKAEDFWTAIAPCEHVLQIYNNSNELLDILSGFIGGGINCGDSVVVIASRPHLDALEVILKKHGVHSESLIEGSRYIPLDAEEVLSRFMVNGYPDEKLFMKAISGIMDRARGQEGRKVRAFGEMVAILWARGQHEATKQLENLWNSFGQREQLTLFCAYSKKGFAGLAGDSISHICGAHSRIVTGSAKPLTEIRHQLIEQNAFSDPVSLTG